MKNTKISLAIITVCLLATFFYGSASCADSNDISMVSSPKLKPQPPESSASKASSEAKMREVLSGYKIGVTTQKQCMNDITAGSWDVNFGGMGMEVLSGKVTLGMTVGIGGRDVCDLVFEGDDPQRTGTGKTPDFGKFLLKEIKFKS